MAFRILGLDPAAFRPLYGLPDAELSRRGARRVVADAEPGFPDRIELRDARVGEALILLNHVHQPAATPYRSRHAIFVRDGALERCDVVDEVPIALSRRPLSLRAFDDAGDMIDVVLIEGGALAETAVRLLERTDAAYLHAHYAAPGCYAARIERA